MKYFVLKIAMASFAMAVGITAWAGDSMPSAEQLETKGDRAIVDRFGNPRSPRAQWVYRIVAKWGAHVHEAYRTDPRRWAESMAQVFAKVSIDALQRAAEARTFAAMNDALLAGTNPAALQPTPASASNGAGSKRIAARSLGDPDQDLVYVPVTPCRILDTRIAGGPIPANSFRDFDLTDVIRYAPQGGDTSNCNVGDKGSFAAAAINFTVVTPGAAGYITAFPYLASQPTAATLNYVAGDIRNGLAITRLDQSAATYEFSVYSFAQTHLVADVVGYFREPEATALSCITVNEITTHPANIDVVTSSPSCPVGLTVTGGGCMPITGGFILVGSNTLETSHYCLSRGSTSFKINTTARCCRIPGR